MGYGIISPRDGYLITGTTASGAASILDCRDCLNFALLTYASWANSAILKLQASHDSTGWLDVLTVTAGVGSGTAQISAFYPFVRGVVNASFASTGSAWMYYSPGNR